jgi:hypothetical protein
VTGGVDLRASACAARLTSESSYSQSRGDVRWLVGPKLVGTGRTGRRVDSSGACARHVQGWLCRALGGLDRGANLERCSRANRSGESAAVDNDHRRHFDDDEVDNQHAHATEGRMADAKKGAADVEESTAEARA